jgi:hypothetical protein
MMKVLTLIFFIYLFQINANAQSNEIVQIQLTNPASTAFEALRFLASDELMGRSAVRPEIQIAARYISETFRGLGLKTLNGQQDYFQNFEIKKKASTEVFQARNVMGWVEGTDPNLKNEFIVLSAHYDHIGVTAHPKLEEGKLDSIYNGTRDNAIGTTSVIDAARYFSKFPAKRSILFIAFTGEEMGLLGSKYFAEHPPIPLKQIVFDLNIDNANYNDTNAISLVGMGRTSADADIKKACELFGFQVLPDPLGGRLFSGSDNLPLAEKGIPAPTYSFGMKNFDQTVQSRYHQLSDELENFDFNYGLKYIYCYILAAQNIANNPAQPKWTKGDPFEAEWNKHYQ